MPRDGPTLRALLHAAAVRWGPSWQVPASTALEAPTATSGVVIVRPTESIAEYLGHHTTNEQFVTQIYKCILFRQLDQRGYDGYVQALQNSFTTRTSVVLNAVTSQEFLSNQGPMLSSATGLPLSSKAILDTYTITPTVSCLSSPSTGNVILVHAPYVMQAQSILKIYSNASTSNTFYSKSIAGSTSMNGPAGFAPSYNPPAMPAALSIIPGNTYYVSLYDPTLNYGSIKQFNIPVCHLGISGSDIVSQLASLMVSLKAILDSLTSLGSH